jgi:hypothetical protein
MSETIFVNMATVVTVRDFLPFNNQFLDPEDGDMFVRNIDTPTRLHGVTAQKTTFRRIAAVNLKTICVSSILSVKYRCFFETVQQKRVSKLLNT